MYVLYGCMDGHIVANDSNDITHLWQKHLLHSIVFFPLLGVSNDMLTGMQTVEILKMNIAIRQWTIRCGTAEL